MAKIFTESIELKDQNSEISPDIIENESIVSSPWVFKDETIHRLEIHPAQSESSEGTVPHTYDPTDLNEGEHNGSAPGRICAHCHTGKTPLWRNGPLGAKTLCNACGLRFKVGKLLLSANGNLVPAEQGKKLQPIKKKSVFPYTRVKRIPIATRRQTNIPMFSNHQGALLLLRLAGEC